MKIVTGFGVLFVIAIVVMLFTSEKIYFSQITAPFIMLGALPLLTYFFAKKNYASNARIGETIEYQFEKDYLIIKGESFSSQLSWDKIHKVTQTKNWLLIWQTRQIANPISKRDVWEGEIAALKAILETHHVKNNL